MTAPVQIFLVCGYAVLLIAVAWLLDLFGRRSARRSREWKTANFVFHDSHGAWKCHEDHWLWPASFDPVKRVIRYRGQHEICGRCPVKDSCAPGVSAREITAPVDPWPYSEAGTFHRGMSLCILIAGLALPAGMLLMARTTAEYVALLATIAVVGLAALPMVRSLRTRPVDIPDEIPIESSVPLDAGFDEIPGPRSRAVTRGVHGQPLTDRASDEAEQLIRRYSSRWSTGSTRQGGSRATRTRTGGPR
ncbi:hypothetical protein [Acidipropionibacterium jensenii]|uniref:Uncharacterized protein n=1 Tax=Acidipropionibacterium jensenii TaxID=1749 RepID=A0A3S4YQD4_9ACTN|nr:Uncharacterised protein [Acidipropionibacterium jensenii]